MLPAPAGSEEVAAGLLVDREVAHRRAVLRRHVGHGGPVRDRERRRALSEELDELSDDLRAPQHLRHDEHEVGRRHALAEPAGHAHAHDVGRQEIDGLSQHSGLGLDASDPPAHDTEAVDHRRVGVGADERVGVVDAVVDEDATRQVLEVDLVHDADSRRDDLETVKRLHAPLQELVAGPVAPKLDLHVHPQRVGGVPLVDLHGVVDDQRDRYERLDALGIALEAGHGRAHGGQVDEQRDPREILKEDAGDDERDLGDSLAAGLPRREGPHVLFLDALAVAVAQERLQHDPDGDGEAGDRPETLLLELRKRVEDAGRTARQGKRLACAGQEAHRRYRIPRDSG